MKLNLLYEQPEPEESLEDLLGQYDEKSDTLKRRPNPGVSDGDSCPECGSELELKSRASPYGERKFWLGCSNGHRYVVDRPTPTPSSKPTSKGAGHTCKPAGKQPNESWASYGKRTTRCPGCKADEDAEYASWDAEMAADDEPENRPGDVEERAEPEDEFDESQPKMMQILNTIRAMGDKAWNRRGPLHERYGKRIRNKELCSFGHTCRDPQLPIPVFGRGLGKGEYGIFSLVTGDVKPEHREYYLEKNNCPACQYFRSNKTGEGPGCLNKVSTKYGRPKPYCKEHIDQSPYIADLMQKAAEGQGKPMGKKEADEAFKAAKREHIEIGDKIKGAGRGITGNIGVVTDIDPNNNPRTHQIKWETVQKGKQDVPYGGGLAWVDPADLKVWDATPKQSRFDTKQFGAGPGWH